MNHAKKDKRIDMAFGFRVVPGRAIHLIKFNQSHKGLRSGGVPVITFVVLFTEFVW